MSGKHLASTTVGARIACLSSFYRFLIRMQLVASNPSDQVERPKARQRTPRGLMAEDVSRFFDHSNLATTTVYLRRLEGREGSSWATARQL